MRESEMRQRIDSFLQRRMRGMLVPALRAGMAFGGLGCTSSMYGTSVPGSFGDAAAANQDAAAAQDVVPDQVIDGEDRDAADAADVLAPVVRYAAQQADAQGSDTRFAVLYMAQMPIGR